jgi:uncharacterized protein YcgL (UPF0745 family)
MSDRSPVSESVAVQVLADNQHTCCICRTPNLHVQLHHIDEDRNNNGSANLAVVCGNCHSRVTGDEGLGRKVSHAEVAEFKRRWELACSVAITAQAERVQMERYFEDRNSTEKINGMEYIMPLYSNPDLALMLGFDTKGRLAIAEIDELKNNLMAAGKLRTVRPKTEKEYEPNTVISETILATKVIIPHWVLKTTVPGVRELAVWVADPSDESLAARSGSAYDFAGTFLYLVTPIYDAVAAVTLYSGCSALQVISNMTTGKSFIALDNEEPFGRRNYAHPTDKLRSIGGIIVDRRCVDVLYKPRYMNDEQCFTKDGKAYRVHDLLGYPLYIANCFELLATRGREQHQSQTKKRRKLQSTV